MASAVYELNPIYHQSEHILNTLFSMAYPDSETVREELKGRTVSMYHHYPSHLPNIVLMPLKTMSLVKKESIC